MAKPFRYFINIKSGEFLKSKTDDFEDLENLVEVTKEEWEEQKRIDAGEQEDTECASF